MPYNSAMDLTGLPGGDLIAMGLRDLAAGRESDESLLVEIGGPRLRQLGIVVPERSDESPEHRLFLRLSAADPRRCHSQYNALVGRLSSFENAARCAR